MTPSPAVTVLQLPAVTSGRQLHLARGRKEHLCLRIADLLKPPTAESCLHSCVVHGSGLLY